MNEKCLFKKTIRIDARIKSIIEKNFQEVCSKTGLKLSYGTIARTFWRALAEDPKLRKKCMELVCKTIVKDNQEKKARSLWKKKQRKLSKP